MLWERCLLVRNTEPELQWSGFDQKRKDNNPTKNQLSSAICWLASVRFFIVKNIEICVFLLHLTIRHFVLLCHIFLPSVCGCTGCVAFSAGKMIYVFSLICCSWSQIDDWLIWNRFPPESCSDVSLICVNIHRAIRLFPQQLPRSLETQEGLR